MIQEHKFDGLCKEAFPLMPALKVGGKKLVDALKWIFKPRAHGPVSPDTSRFGDVLRWMAKHPKTVGIGAGAGVGGSYILGSGGVRKGLDDLSKSLLDWNPKFELSKNIAPTPASDLGMGLSELAKLFLGAGALGTGGWGTYELYKAMRGRSLKDKLKKVVPLQEVFGDEGSDVEIPVLEKESADPTWEPHPDVINREVTLHPLYYTALPLALIGGYIGGGLLARKGLRKFRQTERKERLDELKEEYENTLENLTSSPQLEVKASEYVEKTALDPEVKQTLVRLGAGAGLGGLGGTAYALLAGKPILKPALVGSGLGLGVGGAFDVMERAGRNKPVVSMYNLLAKQYPDPKSREDLPPVWRRFIEDSQLPGQGLTAPSINPLPITPSDEDIAEGRYGVIRNLMAAGGFLAGASALVGGIHGLAGAGPDVNAAKIQAMIKKYRKALAAEPPRVKVVPKKTGLKPFEVKDLGEMNDEDRDDEPEDRRSILEQI